jgi:hypothetical protein
MYAAHLVCHWQGERLMPARHYRTCRIVAFSRKAGQPQQQSTTQGLYSQMHCQRAGSVVSAWHGCRATPSCKPTAYSHVKTHRPD